MQLKPVKRGRKDAKGYWLVTNLAPEIPVEKDSPKDPAPKPRAKRPPAKHKKPASGKRK